MTGVLPKTSDFLVDRYATAFWYVDYKYDRENYRQGHFKSKYKKIRYNFFLRKSALMILILTYVVEVINLFALLFLLPCQEVYDFPCKATLTPLFLLRSSARLSTWRDSHPTFLPAKGRTIFPKRLSSSLFLY